MEAETRMHNLRLDQRACVRVLQMYIQCRALAMANAKARLGTFLPTLPTAVDPTAVTWDHSVPNLK